MAQCKGLQIPKAVGSNPTLTSNYGLVVYWLEYPPVTGMGRVRFSSRPPSFALFVYRLGHPPFTQVRGVRFSYRAPVVFRSSKHGVGGGLLIHEAWFDSRDRSQVTSSTHSEDFVRKPKQSQLLGKITTLEVSVHDLEMTAG